MPNTTPRGRAFQPGQSGNPGGRPKGVAQIRELVQAKGDDLVGKLMEMALGANTEDRVRLEAIKALLDRGYGRPAQPVDGDGEGGPIHLTIGWQDGPEAA